MNPRADVRRTAQRPLPAEVGLCWSLSRWCRAVVLVQVVRADRQADRARPMDVPGSSNSSTWGRTGTSIERWNSPSKVSPALTLRESRVAVGDPQHPYAGPPAGEEIIHAVADRRPPSRAPSRRGPASPGSQRSRAARSRISSTSSTGRPSPPYGPGLAHQTRADQPVPPRPGVLRADRREDGHLFGEFREPPTQEPRAGEVSEDSARRQHQLVGRRSRRNSWSPLSPSRKGRNRP